MSSAVTKNIPWLLASNKQHRQDQFDILTRRMEADKEESLQISDQIASAKTHPVENQEQQVDANIVVSDPVISLLDDSQAAEALMQLGRQNSLPEQQDDLSSQPSKGVTIVSPKESRQQPETNSRNSLSGSALSGFIYIKQDFIVLHTMSGDESTVVQRAHWLAVQIARELITKEERAGKSKTDLAILNLGMERFMQMTEKDRRDLVLRVQGRAREAGSAQQDWIRFPLETTTSTSPAVPSSTLLPDPEQDGPSDTSQDSRTRPASLRLPDIRDAAAVREYRSQLLKRPLAPQGPTTLPVPRSSNGSTLSTDMETQPKSLFKTLQTFNVPGADPLQCLDQSIAKTSASNVGFSPSATAEEVSSGQPEKNQSSLFFSGSDTETNEADEMQKSRAREDSPTIPNPQSVLKRDLEPKTAEEEARFQLRLSRIRDKQKLNQHSHRDKAKKAAKARAKLQSESDLSDDEAEVVGSAQMQQAGHNIRPAENQIPARRDPNVISISFKPTAFKPKSQLRYRHSQPSLYKPSKEVRRLMGKKEKQTYRLKAAPKRTAEQISKDTKKDVFPSTPPPDLSEMNADDTEYESDEARNFEYIYTNQPFEVGDRGPFSHDPTFDWKDLAKRDPRLRGKHFSYTDPGFLGLVEMFGGRCPPKPAGVRESEKRESNMRFGDWYYQQALQYLRQGKIKLGDSQEQNSKWLDKGIIYATEAQRNLWRDSEIQLPWPRKKFNQTKTMRSSQWFIEPKSVMPSYASSDENDVSDKLADDAEDLVEPEKRKTSLSAPAQYTQQTRSQIINKLAQQRLENFQTEALVPGGLADSPHPQGGVQPAGDPNLNLSLSVESAPVTSLSKTLSAGAPERFQSFQTERLIMPAAKAVSKGASGIDWTVTYTVPGCGWGIAANIPADALPLPDGYEYWSPPKGPIKKPSDDFLAKARTQVAPPGWKVYSVLYNRSEAQRKTGRVPPFVLPDECAILEIMYTVQACDRQKMWPATFNKDGLPQVNRLYVGVPPIVLTGSWARKETGMTFAINNYYLLTYRKSCTLRGQDGGEVGGKATNQSWRTIKAMTKARDFCFHELALEITQGRGKHEFGYRIKTSVSGSRQKEDDDSTQPYGKFEMKLEPNTDWWELLVEDYATPYCASDEYGETFEPARKTRSRATTKAKKERRSEGTRSTSVQLAGKPATPVSRLFPPADNRGQSQTPSSRGRGSSVPNPTTSVLSTSHSIPSPAVQADIHRVTALRQTEVEEEDEEEAEQEVEGEADEDEEQPPVKRRRTDDRQISALQWIETQASSVPSKIAQPMPISSDELLERIFTPMVAFARNQTSQNSFMQAAVALSDAVQQDLAEMNQAINLANRKRAAAVQKFITLQEILAEQPADANLNFFAQTAHEMKGHIGAGAVEEACKVVLRDRPPENTATLLNIPGVEDLFGRKNVTLVAVEDIDPEGARMEEAEEEVAALPTVEANPYAGRFD